MATTNGYLQKYQPSTDSFTGFNLFSHSENCNSRWLQKIYPAGKHSLFIGTSSQGIKQFNIDSSTYEDILTYNPDKTTVFVSDIMKYDENEYWFATESGIFILNMETRKFINLKKKFLDP